MAFGGGMMARARTLNMEYNRKERRVSDVAILKRLWRYIRPYRRRLSLIVGAVVISSLCSTLTPYLHGIAIDQIIGTGDVAGFLWWTPLFLGVAAVILVTQYLQQYLMAYIGEHVVWRLRCDMVERLQVLSLRYFAEGETGQVMSRVTNDAEVVRMFFRMGITTIIADIVSIAGAVVLMIYLSPQLSLVSLATIPVILVITFVLGAYSRKAYRRTRRTIATVTSLTQEGVAGMRVIQSFAKEEGALQAFEAAQEENVQANLHATKVSLSYRPFVGSARIVGTIIILWVAALLYESGALTVATQLGVLVAFLEYQMQLFRPLMTLSEVYVQYQSAMAALERLFDLMDTRVEVTERPPPDIVELPPFHHAIHFDHVTFGYDPAVPVIHDVSFTIPHNQRVALVGPTGAGKSTLINLLCRFYDPLRGRITIDGHDLRDVSLASLRSQIGIVLQDSFLFNTTVRENIRYGRPMATDAEVIAAATAVGAHEFILRLPQGYDSLISEGAANISLGQRQLISFARALLMNPRILILDEATSSVDPYTELIIQTALQKLLQDRTAIIIAHRLSTVRSADKIVVLDKGQIVEEGPHRQLLAANGLYSLLYRSQLRDDLTLEPPVASLHQS